MLLVLQAGFKYHHAEPDYLMLVHWIPNTPDTLPANASHRVNIGAFVMNTNKEVILSSFSLFNDPRFFYLFLPSLQSINYYIWPPKL